MPINNFQDNSLKLPKTARLHHRSLVERLFREGKSFYEYPLRVTWHIYSPQELDTNFRNNVPEGIGKLQMMVTVPKKKRRRAVDRVLMRRRIKEAYRLNRSFLKRAIEDNPEIRSLSVAFIYMHDSNSDYLEIENKMKKALEKLLTIINRRK